MEPILPPVLRRPHGQPPKKKRSMKPMEKGLKSIRKEAKETVQNVVNHDIMSKHVDERLEVITRSILLLLLRIIGQSYQ